MKLRLPSINMVLNTLVVMAVASFAMKVLPIPEGVKNIFRI